MITFWIVEKLMNKILAFIDQFVSFSNQKI